MTSYVVARPRWRQCIVSARVRVDDAKWTRRRLPGERSFTPRGPLTDLGQSKTIQEDGRDDRERVQRVGRFVPTDHHWHEGEGTKRFRSLGSTEYSRFYGFTAKICTSSSLGFLYIILRFFSVSFFYFFCILFVGLWGISCMYLNIFVLLERFLFDQPLSFDWY